MRTPFGRSTLPLDAAAFAELYQAHLAAVFNYCLFRVGDRQLAEDLAADVFERAWRARGRYRPDQASFATWVLAVARNAVVDCQRHNGRHPMVALPADLLDDAPLPDTAVEAADEQARLKAMIATLPEADQDLIALKFGAGLPNRQIGEFLGRSEGAVGVALHRVMRKLRASWEISDEVLER
ncbi:MAG: sigma-70 family RNA polymerase sigma factor [Anaerolineales bacterium]|nr:sigma-70 family RNA polymerase sigma factor [Anaerolineales bacterium]